MSKNTQKLDPEEIFKIENLTSDNYTYVSQINDENLKYIENLLTECLNRKSSKELLFRQFYLACFWGFKDIAKKLLELNPNLDINEACSVTGWSPLHACTFQEHGPLVYLLLEHEASINLRDSQGRSPVDFASASEIIWPHFAAINCRRTNKKDLLSRKIFSKSQLSAVIQGESNNSKPYNQIKFAPYQISKTDMGNLDSDAYTNAYNDGDVLARFNNE